MLTATAKDSSSGLSASHYKHGALLAFSAVIAPFVSAVKLKELKGLIAAATVSLPNFPKVLIASIYVPKDSFLKNELQKTISDLMDAHALSIFLGHVNYTFQHLDGENVLHSPK